MLVGATLKPNNNIFRNWRHQRLLQGSLHDVPFRWTGVEYVANDVPEDKVDVLRKHPNVVIHIIALCPAHGDSLVAPVVAEKHSPEPVVAEKHSLEPTQSEKCIQTSDKAAPVEAESLDTVQVPRPRGRPPLNRKP